MKYYIFVLNKKHLFSNSVFTLTVSDFDTLLDFLKLNYIDYPGYKFLVINPKNNQFRIVNGDYYE